MEIEIRSVRENARVRATEVRRIREEEDLNELWLGINGEGEATAVEPKGLQLRG